MPHHGSARGTNALGRGYPAVTSRVAKGYIEQLPSGSFRVSVYAGTDPLTRREIRLKSTVKIGQQARIELGRLLKEASEGRTPESGATVARLMEEYAAIAPWDVSTPPRRVPPARLPPDEAQHHPRHPRHLVRRVRRRAAVGMDRPQPRRDSQTAPPSPASPSRPPRPTTSPR